VCMEFNFFRDQINRLAETYGATHYKDERIKIIWKELEEFSNQWLTKTIDYFIGNLRQPPLMAEFRDEISKERERLYQIKKKEQSKEAKEFMSAYSGEDIQTICGQIVKRLIGGMNDQDFKCFTEMLKQPGESLKCAICEGTGVYYDEEYKGMTICSCAINKNRFGVN
jgi:hypothetical protein